jgi:hypothetical protein
MQGFSPQRDSRSTGTHCMEKQEEVRDGSEAIHE